MNTILITTIVITVIGIVVGAGLVFTGKKFFVPVDEREAAVRECLPGNNCGACGYAGCDAMAAAIVSGEAPVNGCPVGGAPVAEKIGGIMGTDAAVLERKVAFVRCKGTCEASGLQGVYTGIRDCRAAASLTVPAWITAAFGSWGIPGFSPVRTIRFPPMIRYSGSYRWQSSIRAALTYS